MSPVHHICSVEDWATAQTLGQLAPPSLAHEGFVHLSTAAQVDGSEGRSIVRAIRGQPHTFTGLNFLLQYALPNFYFHSATAYGILRSNGVELGKADFIGALD